MTANTYQALVSDLDGTLIDSEPIHGDAWIATFAQYQLHFDHYWFEQWIGTSDKYLAQQTIDAHQLNVGVRDLQNQKQALYHQLVHTHLQLFPGVETWLKRMKGVLPMAIATNSGRGDAIEVFKATGLDRLFDSTVTADDVPNLKPAPDMYLLAAQQLGIDPKHCVAIEDSPAGAQAANTAGMYVLGLTTSQAAEKMTAAHEIFDTTKEALERVEALVSLAANI